MNYDKVYELIAVIKATTEYAAYIETREIAYQNDLNAALIKEMKLLQRSMQAAVYGGQRIDEVSEQRMQKIGETLQFNREAADFLLAEYNFNRIISEVFGIIAQGVEIDLVFGRE